MYSIYLNLYLKDPIIEECFSDDTKKTPTEVDKKESKCEGTNLSFMLTPDTIGGLLVNMPQVKYLRINNLLLKFLYKIKYNF